MFCVKQNSFDKKENLRSFHRLLQNYLEQIFSETPHLIIMCQLLANKQRENENYDKLSVNTAVSRNILMHIYKTINPPIAFLKLTVQTHFSSKPPAMMWTNLFPIHSFSVPWKHQKTLRFSDVFSGTEKVGNKWVNKNIVK